MYNLETAAEATGRAKNTIRAAIVSGRLSAKQTATGRWRIDPAELHRVYPAVTKAKRSVQQKVHKSHNSDLLLEILKEERDREREQLQATIRDLRQRLDKAQEERAALTTRLLTYDKPRTWWQRIFG